jgi:ATP-dependent Zn protease
METAASNLVAPDESHRVLYHEAGHAVVAVRHQIPFLHVERMEGDNGKVEVGVVGPLESPDRAHSQEEIAGWQRFYAAGAAAERLFFGEYRDYGTKADRALHDRLEKLRSIQRDRAWDVDIQSAMKVLDRKSVQKIAEALGQDIKLGEEQVHDLLGCKPSWW